jgi:hypothetical protein
VPGDVRPPYTQASQARQVLNDAEDDLREWRLDPGILGDDAKSVGVENEAPVMQRNEEKGKQTEGFETQRPVEQGGFVETVGDGSSVRV